MPRKIYTIGHTRKSLEKFISLLRQAGVDAVIDIRRRNTSQLAGFAKKDDLAFLLREGFGIAYEHVPELAPSAELLATYRESHDWPAYEQEYKKQLLAGEALSRGQALLARYRQPCFLCSEDEPDFCHRRLLAEYLAASIPGLAVEHLR